MTTLAVQELSMITIPYESSEFVVDENVTLETMKQEYPGFFKPTAPGSVYTYTAHRGGLVVRYNVNFGTLTRLTNVFLYTTYKGQRRMIPVQTDQKIQSVDQGKRLIDRALDTANIKPNFWLKK